MFELFGQSFVVLMQRGGVVMWPLLLMSVAAIAMAFERCWFWARTNHYRRTARVERMARLLRAGQGAEVRLLARGDRSVYGRLVQHLLDESTTDAVAMAAVEAQRPRLERFMPALSTIITAAPMLGILGTVLGIISSFQILGDQRSAADPAAVSHGIAEALLTTAAGLLVALAVLLPYNAFRAQMDRTLGRLEVLVSAAQSGLAGAEGKGGTAVNAAHRNDTSQGEAGGSGSNPGGRPVG